MFMTKWQKMEVNQINRDQGRTLINSAEKKGIINLNAAMSLLKGVDRDLEHRMKQVGALASLRGARGMLKSAMDKILLTVEARQLKAMANAVDDNGYVCVKATNGPYTVAVNADDLADIVHIARGGLIDEQEQSRSCRDCLACMNKQEWSKCPLYDLINRMPCTTWEHGLDDQNLCPYAVPEGSEKL